MKKRLLFDISTNVMYVGYAKDDELKDFSIRLAKKDHAKYLVDRIDQVLKRNKLSLDDLDEIIVGIGPGSYTGLRIAVMVAKMLGYARAIPIRTVSSLLFMTSGYEGKVAALIDARRGHVFSAIYENGQTLLDEALRSVNELSSMPLYQQAQTIYVDENHYEICPRRIIEHATLVSDIHALIPNYLRKTEAEQTYEQKSKNE